MIAGGAGGYFLAGGELSGSGGHGVVWLVVGVCRSTAATIPNRLGLPRKIVLNREKTF
jgi:hypothetical protein